MSYAKGYGLGQDSGPPGPDPLASSVPSPTELSQIFKAKNLKTNAALALLLLLLVALPATIFNATLKEHHKTIASSKGSIRRFVDAVERRLEALHPGALLALFAIVGAALYALVDPTFGANASSMAEVAGYVGAILIITATTEIARGLYVKRRFNKIADLRAFPLGIVIAIVLVLFSRLSHFEPGYVFGVFAAIVFRIKPTSEEDGKSVTMSSWWLMGVAVASWFVWIPVKDAVISGNHAFVLLVIDSLLSTVWVCGLQSLLFGLIPMKYLDGEAVFKWSKAIWVVTYVIVVFFFVQFIVHPTAAGYGGNSHANFASMLYLFMAFTGFSGIFWIYCRIRFGKSEEDDAGGSDDTGNGETEHALV